MSQYQEQPASIRCGELVPPASFSAAFSESFLSTVDGRATHEVTGLVEAAVSSKSCKAVMINVSSLVCYISRAGKCDHAQRVLLSQTCTDVLWRHRTLSCDVGCLHGNMQIKTSHIIISCKQVSSPATPASITQIQQHVC
jgi:hypothetical protein